MQGDTVCMVNLSLETWTEISMEEMFLEWQTIKKIIISVMTMWKGILVAQCSINHELSGYPNFPLAFS